MFRRLTPETDRFRGYEVLLFRQGRAPSAVRRLMRRTVVFAPHRGKVGVFLPEASGAFSRDDLERAWYEQGAPAVQLPTADERVLLGRLIRLKVTPYVGYDDAWLDGVCLNLTCRRAPTKDIDSRVGRFLQTELLRAAEAALERFRPRLTRLPSQIVIKPLRQRILGQCTRDGEIRLNLTLLQWPETVLEETLAHELSHLVCFNHSPAFWETLTVLLPDWLPRSLCHYLT